MEQVIPLLFIPSIFCRYLCENFKHLSIQMIQLPVLLVEGGIPPGLVGPLSWQCYATAKKHGNLITFATCKILQIYRTCDQGHRVDVQAWKIAHEKEGTNKRYITALLNGKQNSHPFHTLSHEVSISHVAQYSCEGL